MNTTLPLPPALLHFVAVLLFGSAAALVAAHATMFALAGTRTTLPPKTQRKAALAVVLVLGPGLGWALVVAQQRALSGPSSEPASPLASLSTLAAIVVAIGAGSAFLASRTVRTINAATPPAWLIGVQVYRAAGVIFLWPFLGPGLLPAGFAVPAGVGDVLTGVMAPFVAFAVARNRPGAHAWAVAWNWFGIIDLVVAPTAAVLAGAQVATLYPLGLIPIFLGPPLGILTHIYSLRNLAAHRQAAAATASASPGAS